MPRKKSKVQRLTALTREVQVLRERNIKLALDNERLRNTVAHYRQDWKINRQEEAKRLAP